MNKTQVLSNGDFSIYEVRPKNKKASGKTSTFRLMRTDNLTKTNTYISTLDLIDILKKHTVK